jgi:hypothetical protein
MRTSERGVANPSADGASGYPSSMHIAAVSELTRHLGRRIAQLGRMFRSAELVLVDHCCLVRVSVCLQR